jgi:hypothetical protein
MPIPPPPPLVAPKYEDEKLAPIPTPTHTTRYAPLRPSHLNPTPPSSPPGIIVVNTRRKLYKSRSARRSDVGLGQRLLRRKAAVAYRSETDQRPGERETPNRRAATGNTKPNTNSGGNGSGSGNACVSRLARQGGRGSTNPLLELWRHEHAGGNRFAAQGNNNGSISGNRFAAAQGNRGNTRMNRLAPGADRDRNWREQGKCEGQDRGAVVPQGGRQQQQQREDAAGEKEAKEAETESKVQDCTTQYDHDNGGNTERVRCPSQTDAFHTVDIARVQSQLFMTTEPGTVVAFPIRRKPDIASVRLAIVVLALVCIVGLVQCALRSFWWLSDVPE